MACQTCLALERKERSIKKHTHVHTYGIDAFRWLRGPAAATCKPCSCSNAQEKEQVLWLCGFAIATCKPYICSFTSRNLQCCWPPPRPSPLPPEKTYRTHNASGASEACNAWKHSTSGASEVWNAWQSTAVGASEAWNVGKLDTFGASGTFRWQNRNANSFLGAFDFKSGRSRTKNIRFDSFWTSFQHNILVISEPWRVTGLEEVHNNSGGSNLGISEHILLLALPSCGIRENTAKYVKWLPHKFHFSQV